MWANTNRTDPSRLALTKNKILNLTNTLPALITFSEFSSTDFFKDHIPFELAYGDGVAGSHTEGHCSWQ